MQRCFSMSYQARKAQCCFQNSKNISYWAAYRSHMSHKTVNGGCFFGGTFPFLAKYRLAASIMDLWKKSHLQFTFQLHNGPIKQEKGEQFQLFSIRFSLVWVASNSKKNTDTTESKNARNTWEVPPLLLAFTAFRGIQMNGDSFCSFLIFFASYVWS